YGISLVQPLFRQQNWHAYSIADLQVAQSEAQLKNAEQELILRVAQAYFDVLIAQENVQSSEAQKAAIIGQLHQAKELFNAGSATITDVYEAQARLDLVNAQAIVANSNLATRRTALQQMVNVPLTTLQAPNTPNKPGQQFKLVPPHPPDMQFWLDNAQRNNPLLNIAKISVELAKKDRIRNRDGHYPTLDLVANYARNFSDAPLGSNNRAASVGVQLNMPLFQGGSTQSKWREAEANYDRIRDDLSVAQRNLAVQTQQAFLGVGSGVAQVQALQQALKSSESLLEASKLGQSAGVRTNLDVLNAQQQLYATRRDLAQAQYAYLYSLLQLNAAIGTLTEEVLTKVNLALH
ncbi:MAG: TolC family outer membrane protein, partial [Candidatus Nitrotoga sp.]